MPESKATIVITAKDQAGATMNKIFMEVNASMAKTTDASKKLGDSQQDASNKTKAHGMNLVDIAAKLYLVQTALRGVAEAAQAAFEFGKLGAEVSQTKISFDNMTKSVGSNVQLLDELRVASKGTISDMQLMQAAQTALIGLGEENGKVMADAIPRILEIARAASIANPALGDTGFLFESLTTGLKRMSPRLIDNTGLQLKLGEANEKYAAILGKTVEELSAEEKQIALLNATLEAGDRLIEQIGGTTESTTDSYNQLTASSENLKNALAVELDPAIRLVVDTLNKAVTATELLVSWNDRLATAVAQNADNVFESSDAYGIYRNKLIQAAEAAGMVVDKEGRLHQIRQDVLGGVRDEITENYILSKSQFEVAKGINQVSDAHDRNSAAMEVGIQRASEITEADEKFMEKRTQSLNSLFVRQLQINQRRVDAEERTTEKIKSVNDDLAEDLTRIQRDAEDDRTRITSDAAEDRLQIEQDYTRKISDANKDLSELYDELAGKNPYLSQDTQTGLNNAEAMVDGLEDRLRDLRSQQRHNPDDEVLQNEIANVRDQLDLANEVYADAKDKAREEENRKRLEAQILEKQQLLAHLEAQKQEELANVSTKEQEKLAIVSATEAAMSAKTTQESKIRLEALREEFRGIKDAAQKDIAIATVDSFMGLVDANSKVGQSLFELQAKNYGASDSMIKDFIAVRESIDSPTGITAALESFGNSNYFGNMISQAIGLNNQLRITSGLVNSLGGNLAPPDVLTINGRRAAGGSVAPNGSYLVGENGPEVLNMGSSGGSITPNHALGGGGGLTVIVQAGVFNGSRADAEKLAGWIGPILDQRQERFGGAYNASGTRRIQSAGRR